MGQFHFSKCSLLFGFSCGRVFHYLREALKDAAKFADFFLVMDLAAESKLRLHVVFCVKEEVDLRTSFFL